MKKLIIIAIVISALVLGVVLAKNLIIKAVLAKGIKAISGLEINIGSINAGIMNTLVGVNNLKIFNPKDFNDKVMAEIPEVFINYDLGAFLKKKVHLEELRLDLKELVIEQNSKRQLNINSLTALLPRKSQEKPPEIIIDSLSVKIGKVIYKEYISGKPNVREFDLNINEHYRNINNPKALVSTILLRALANTNIASLANINLGALKEISKQDLNSAKTLITDTVKDTLEKKNLDLKEIFQLKKEN